MGINHFCNHDDGREAALTAEPPHMPCPPEPGSPLYERLRIDALPWPADGKDYGQDRIYKDRDGILRVRPAEFDEREP